MSMIPFPGEKNQSNNERKITANDERLNKKIQNFFTDVIKNVNCNTAFNEGLVFLKT